MARDLIAHMEQYGAAASQVVDLARTEAATLRYADLRRSADGDCPALVIESQKQPRVYVYDQRDPSDALPLAARLVRRIAFRGDAEFIAVARPGRLDVYAAALGTRHQPQALKNLPEGILRIPALLHSPPQFESGSVRTALRDLLRKSINAAKKIADVDAHDALSLVGRALFWRFLIDRNLLDGLKPGDICGNANVASFPECVAHKAPALRTFDWLDQTFNGGLLRFSSQGRAGELPDAVFEQVVGNIAHAATAAGQLQLDLPSDWKDVNFAHVPVGLLSEVYEAFAHDENAGDAKRDSIFYTPRHIAEFMVEEALAALGQVAQPKVLDPAAGAGVFLVAAFRALVAREWSLTGRPPSRAVIRRILCEQLTGFDINDSALRLAELALYLTAIELDPEEKPRPLSLLKFDRPLREATLFCPSGDFARGSLGPVEPRFRGQFDLVIGNPPWSATGTMDDKLRWTKDTRPLIQERLGMARAKSFTLPDTYPDIPFLYRAMEWARPGGHIALVTHARWLFPGKVRDEARRNLLQSVQVTGILNGTALRETAVWPGSRAPFAVVFACNAVPDATTAMLQFVSPAVMDDRQKKQTRLRIDWNDAQPVAVQSIIAKPWLLKVRFRGGAFDEGVVDRLVAGYLPFEQYLVQLGSQLRNGYIVGSRQDPAEWLVDLKCISANSVKQSLASESESDPPVGFHAVPETLAVCGEERVERRRPRNTYAAPLLIVRESPPAEVSEPRSTVAEVDVAYSQSWHGASFAKIPDGLLVARHLQLLLQSSVFLYYQLLVDGHFGVERDRYVMETLKSFPVVAVAELAPAARADVLALSASLWAHGWSEELQERIDDLVFDLYGLDDVERDSIRDTLATSLPYAKQRHNALLRPTPTERARFAETLQDELTSVLAASHERAEVLVRRDTAEVPWTVLQVNRLGQDQTAPTNVAIPWAEILTEADASGATLITVRAADAATMVALLDQYRYWTVTRARILALSLLSKEWA